MRARNQEAWDADEARRLEALGSARKAYDAECAQRQADAANQNEALEQLITNLGYATPEAIEEYISIVLANSVYPDHFQVAHDFTFEPSTAELTLTVLIQEPSLIETTKAHKYVRASDEMSTTELSQKAQKDRYAGAAHHVALRTLHEVFEADRRGLVRSMSLTVGAVAPNPATGINEVIPFVAVAAERETFLEMDLSAVVPAATLEHLGASLSKNPFGLVPAVVSGVRRS
jgi:restriction system protein